MNAHIQVLIEVCRQRSIPFQLNVQSGNSIAIQLNHQFYHFINWSTPLNSHAVAELCLDKGFFYESFHNQLITPETKMILDPQCNALYRDYVKNESLEQIVDEIEQDFQYPMIVKRHRGFGGRGVFKVQQRSALLSAIQGLFDKQSALYDYIVLVQQYINACKEYRAVFVDSQLVFAYEKNCQMAEFKGNLSPMHWQGAKAVLVENPALLNTMQKMTPQLFKQLNIPYCGLDFISDQSAKMWMVEANCSPAFNFFMRDNGVEKIHGLYHAMLDYLTGLEK